MTYCEDYPCCGHTDLDPCPGRSVISEPWYCDDCGTHHYTDYCTQDYLDDEDEDDEEDPYGYIQAEYEAQLDQFYFDNGMETPNWQDSY